MIRNEFKKYYQTQLEPAVFKSPGRVNIIGEHTDYNGGYVLPMAIDFATRIALRLREDDHVRIYSKNINQFAEFSLKQNFDSKKRRWFYYIAGVLQLLEQHSYKMRGADIYIESTIPMGAGLSSSAALEVGIAFAFLTLLDYPIDLIKLAKICQQAEHEYAGTKCGIMDQYICAMGKKDHALLINCDTLLAKPVPMNLEGAIFAICDTGVHHSLATSEYNQRRAECQRVGTPIYEKRMRHVQSENERVLQAVEAMQQGDLKQLGMLMLASHRSLQHDYAVSCAELDFLVDTASKLPYVYGARMTGGGFGGCTVSLLQKEHLENFIHVLTEAYQQKFNLVLKVYVSNACQGVSKI